MYDFEKFVNTLLLTVNTLNETTTDYHLFMVFNMIRASKLGNLYLRFLQDV